jgi:Glycosyltransferase family 87
MRTPADLEQPDRPVGLWPPQARWAAVGAVLLWVVPMVVIGVVVGLRPMHRTVTWDSYHLSAAHWWAGESLYTGPGGMNYLPHFAVLFSPFHWLPLWLGEVLWRYCAAAALAGGLWWLVRTLFREGPERPFFWATLLAMPLCMTSLRNGNANAHFGGVAVLAVAAMLNRRWWLALGLMALLTAIKPLGVVLLLLAPIVFSPLRWRLPLALVGLAVFPFLFGRPAYVASQYREAWSNLQACAVVSEHRFADINGIFRTFGTAIPPEVSKLVRVLAGGLSAGLCWWGARRLRGPLPALWLYALAAGYLMLFNPMNEENSYSILAPVLGVWGAFFLFSSAARAARSLGWVIVFMALTMALLPNLVRPLFGNHFALFWHPLMTLVFLALLGGFVWRSAPPAAELAAAPA